MRTGVSLIGLGFVVARFGLLLHQDHASIVRSAPRPFGVSLSSWLGTVIVVLAAVLVALSYARYGQIAHALDLGTYCDRRRLTTGLMLVVVLISIVLSIYLVVTG
jgi:putative membrane protein